MEWRCKVRVRDVLGQKPSRLVTVEPDAHLGAAVALLMGNDVGGLPVISRDGRMLGFLSERDIVRAVREHAGSVQHVRVDHVMRSGATCDADDGLREVMQRMTTERLRHLVVQDGGRAIGVISVGDIVKHRLEQLETETGVLRDYVAGQRAVR
jgi:CBS domain-containing protein